MTRRSALVVVLAVIATVGVMFLLTRREETRHGRDVVTIISYGGIDGPREFHRGYHPYDAGFAALPDTMPKARTNWDLQCGEVGWEVIYANGDHRYYSSCNGSGWPDSLEPASCGLSGFQPPPKSGTPHCGPRLS